VSPSLSYDIRPCPLSEVDDLCKRFHGYGGAGATSTYAFAVYEDDTPIAAYAWQPPPPGAAKSVCPEQPAAVLSLSRMVAVDRSMRKLNHVSKPLRRQMTHFIDRGRWPVLVTYHDEGQGHTGHVYKCSGWTLTRQGELRTFYVDADGNRTSPYSNGKMRGSTLRVGGETRVHRWEHWACGRGEVAAWMSSHGWLRTPVLGKMWRSGNQAYRWKRAS
jgi:hypothetical protein